jgi:hypothetical protein
MYPVVSAASQAASIPAQPDKENSSPPEVSGLALKLSQVSLTCQGTGSSSLLHQKVATIDCSRAISRQTVSSFIASLDDYSVSSNNFTGALQLFLDKNTPYFFPDTPQVTPHLIQAGGTKGVSGAGVFVIRDQQQKVCAIVKGFLSAEELIQEIRAQGMLSELSLTQSTFPPALQIGKCTADRQIYLMLQKVADGEGLDDMFVPFISKQLLPTERKEQLAFLEQALCQTAKALAELHSTRIQTRADAQGVQLMIQNLVQELTALRKETKSPYLEDIVFDTPVSQSKNPKTSLVDFVNYTIDEFKAEPGPGVIVHGDAHQGNFFYERVKRVVTLIDLPTMSRSFSASGQGLMTPEWDVQLFAEKIPDVAKVGTALTPDEASALKKVFKKTYRTFTPHIHTSAAAKRLCKLNRILTVIVKRIQALKEHPSDEDPKKRMIERIITDRKASLKKMMMGYTPSSTPLQTVPVHTGPIPKFKNRLVAPRK